MLGWFPLYYNVNQLYVYLYCLCLEPPSNRHLKPLSHDRSTQLSSQCNIAASHWQSTSHAVVYICQCFCFTLSHLLLPSLGPHVCSLSLHLYSCLVNMLINSLSQLSLSFILQLLNSCYESLLSRVRLLATPWTIQSMEFPGSEYWSGQPLPSPRDLPNPGIEPRTSCIAGRFFTS